MARLLGLFAVTLAMTVVEAAPAARAAPGFRLTVVFDNVGQGPGLRSGWGFSCLIQGGDRTVLFDTGADGAVLLANMRRLGLEPSGVRAIVLSHIHADHTGGLEAFLGANADVEVWLPAGFPAGFLQAIRDRGARVRPVSEGGRLFDRAFSTGPLHDGIIEQALVLDTAKGLVIVTGCAHPGIVKIAETAVRVTGKRIHLVVGGFHLMRADDREIRAAVSGLRRLGVEKVAPSHCTGAAAIARFREAWGEDFVEGGLGAVIEVPSR